MRIAPDDGVRALGIRRETSEKRLAAGADIPGHIVAKPSHSARVRGTDGDIPLVTDDMTRFRVEDHDAFELQLAVWIAFIDPGTESGCRFRVDQFRIASAVLFCCCRQSVHEET